MNQSFKLEFLRIATNWLPDLLKSDENFHFSWLFRTLLTWISYENWILFHTKLLLEWCCAKGLRNLSFQLSSNKINILEDTETVIRCL